MSDSSPTASNPSNSSASRRDFLKSSTALVVGGALAGTLSLPRNAHAAGSDTIKIALIGCGGRGSGAVKDAIHASRAIGAKLKLVVMADAFADRIEHSLQTLLKEDEGLADSIDVAKERQFVGLDAYQKALATDVDMAFLATPPGFRPIHFEAAVAAGKNIFMEKPVATDPAGVRRVLAAAAESKKKGLGVGVGLQRRHSAKYIETIGRVRDGAIGDIVAMRAYWNGTTPWVHPRADLLRQWPKLTEMEYQMRNWYYFNWICGDHIVEQHIHNLDVINWVKDAYPVSACGLGGCQVRKGEDYGETFDHHAVEFIYKDGSRLSSQCRHIRGCWDDVSEHCVGTKGVADTQDGKLFQIAVKGSDPWRPARGRAVSPYQVEHEDLLKSIRDGKPNNEAERGALSTMTAIFGRMATYSGQLLQWEDALNSQISIMPTEYSFTATPPTLPDAHGMYAHPLPGITKVLSAPKQERDGL